MNKLAGEYASLICLEQAQQANIFNFISPKNN